jgi:hypothetical protein
MVKAGRIGVIISQLENFDVDGKKSICHLVSFKIGWAKDSYRLVSREQ